MGIHNFTWAILLIVNLYFLSEIECVRDGDVVTDLSRFRYLAAIKVQTGDFRELCGGAILNDWMILTAAHCFIDRQGVKADKVIIRVHTFKNRGSILGRDRKAEKVFIPKAYAQGSDDDIAIVKLKKSLNLAKNADKLQAVSLPSSNNIPDNAEALISGYGANKIENGQAKTDRRLRSLDVTIIPNRACPKQKATNPGTGRLYLCARARNPIDGKPQGFCDGDSGGPLVIERPNNQFEIVGVIEESDQLCDGSPGLYIKVFPYISTFISKVQNNALDSTIETIDLSTSSSCGL